MKKIKKSKSIIQTIIFNAPVHDVFELIMDSKKHTAFSGEKAAISRKIGGSFKAYDKYISGKNLEIVKDKKIVQSWRTCDWPKGKYSKVTFEFEKYEKKTRLKFLHEDVPKEQYETLRQGWIDFYWEPIKKFLEEEYKY